jgi:hypothetical protein
VAARRNSSFAPVGPRRRNRSSFKIRLRWAKTPTEVRQTGGRAGRYGQHEEGVVAVLASGGDPARLRSLMGTSPRPRV